MPGKQDVVYQSFMPLDFGGPVRRVVTRVPALPCLRGVRGDDDFWVDESFPALAATRLPAASANRRSMPPCHQWQYSGMRKTALAERACVRRARCRCGSPARSRCRSIGRAQWLCQGSDWPRPKCPGAINWLAAGPELLRLPGATLGVTIHAAGERTGEVAA